MTGIISSENKFAIKFGQSYGEARLSRQANARSSEKTRALSTYCKAGQKPLQGGLYLVTEVTSVNLSDHKNSWS